MGSGQTNLPQGWIKLKKKSFREAFAPPKQLLSITVKHLIAIFLGKLKAPPGALNSPHLPHTLHFTLSSTELKFGHFFMQCQNLWACETQCSTKHNSNNYQNPTLSEYVRQNYPLHQSPAKVQQHSPV